MWFTTRNEIEYLNSLDPRTAGDGQLVLELTRRLDALRRYDQDYRNDEWHTAPLIARKRVYEQQ
jgi:hypothetical protein